MKNYRAFTLTEVLITLGIIGVISALTVPNIMNNYQKESQAVQFRKFVTEFQSAVDMTITEYGKTSLKSTYIMKKTNGVDEFIKNKFNPKKTCTKDETANCFASSYRSIDLGTVKFFTCDGKSYVLANSAAMCVNKRTNSLNIYVDINGQEAPNMGGRDMFLFAIDINGNATEGFATAQDNSAACEKCMAETEETYGDDTHYNECFGEGLPCSVDSDENQCPKTAFGAGCYTRLSKNGWKMNY